VPITLFADPGLLPGQYKIEAEHPAEKEQARTEQRIHKQLQHKQDLQPETKKTEEPSELSAQDAGTAPATQQDQKRRRKWRPRRGKRASRKGEAVAETPAETAAEGTLADPIQEGI